MSSVRIQPEIAEALAVGRAVVALESAVLTTGLPRTPLAKPTEFEAPGWEEAHPLNFEIVRLMQRLVREHGAIPAVIAVMDGSLRIGLTDAELEALASDESAGKASTTNLAAAIRSGRSAGTTVSATLHACALAGRQTPNGKPIRVFATGGIGGVHRGWSQTPDVSADLVQLARTPVCVVCAGAKSILDIPATLEALQALGVPVIGFGTDVLPQFFSHGDASLPINTRCDEPTEVAAMCNLHWNDLHLPAGVLVANPLNEALVLDAKEIELITEQAERDAERDGVTGDARTPRLLQYLSKETGGRSLRANLALLAGNAALAGRIASCMSG